MSRVLGLVAAMAVLSGCCPEGRPTQDPFSLFGPTRIEPTPTCGQPRCGPADPGYRGTVDDGIGPIPETGFPSTSRPPVQAVPRTGGSRLPAVQTSPPAGGSDSPLRWTPRGSTSAPLSSSVAPAPEPQTGRPAALREPRLLAPPAKVVDITELPDWERKPQEPSASKWTASQGVRFASGESDGPLAETK